MTGWGLALGLRLTFTGGREGRIRLLMMVGGVAAGVVLLLAVGGVLPAVVERIGKNAARAVVPTADAGTRTEGVRAALSVGFWRGREIRVLRVEVVGPAVAPPLGVPRTPQAGEMFVSPALAAVLAGTHGAELAPRLPERMVGTVTPAGLVGPEEMYAVAGPPPGGLVGPPGIESGLSTAFERPAKGSLFASQGVHVDGTGMGQEANATGTLLVVVALAGVGLVVPLLVLIGTSVRLSQASRERRASAMRLVGATAGQLRMLGAVEAAVVGALGVLAGTGLFFLLRAPVAALLPIPDGLYPQDVAPPPAVAMAVLVGVPALAALTGSLALRRAVASPLGVRRQAKPARAGAFRLLPLGLGLAMLVGAYADRRAVLAGAWHGRALLLGGAVMCLVGLAVGAAALARVTGLAVARWGPGLASQLAGRRLIADPAGAARAVTGTALVVVLLGWVVALLPVLDQIDVDGDDGLAGALRPHTVVVTLAADARVEPVVETLRAVDGVAQVAAVRHLDLLPPGVRPTDCCSDGTARIGEQNVRAVIADCDDLGRILRAPLSDCRPNTLHYLTGSYFPSSTITAAGRLQPVIEPDRPPAGPILDVPAELPEVTLPDEFTNRTDGLLLAGDLLVPPTMLPADLPDEWFPNLLVATDGRAETLEAVRARLGAQQTPFPPLTAEEAVVLARSSSDGYTRAALLMTIAVVLAGGLSLAVTTADGIRERHRAHSALTAMGTPARVLRHSALLYAALPLALTIGFAVLVTAASSWLLVGLSASTGVAPPPLPWDGYAAIGTTTLVACLLATAATLPFVRAVTRPDALRIE
ncbi:FtsX-like permease family protein [Plantactinospora sp. DSM 117369]